MIKMSMSNQYFFNLDTIILCRIDNTFDLATRICNYRTAGLLAVE